MYTRKSTSACSSCFYVRRNVQSIYAWEGTLLVRAEPLNSKCGSSHDLCICLKWICKMNVNLPSTIYHLSSWPSLLPLHLLRLSFSLLGNFPFFPILLGQVSSPPFCYILPLLTLGKLFPIIFISRSNSVILSRPTAHISRLIAFHFHLHCHPFPKFGLVLTFQVFRVTAAL